MQTGLHFEAFYVSWIYVSDKYYMRNVGQDLRRKADSAVSNSVQVQVRRLSSSFQDGFVGQSRDHLPDQVYNTPSSREHVQPLQQTVGEAGGDLRAADVLSDFAHRQKEIISRG